MKNTNRIAALTRRLGSISVIAALVALASAPNSMNAQSTCSAACQTAAKYVTNFYPLWFTHNQSAKATLNQLIGPRTVSPLYQTVVAVNVDTLYASSFMELPPTDGAVLTIPSTITIPSTGQTIPSTNLVFSVLLLDRYGNIYPNNVKTPGTYVFEGPGYQPSPTQPLPAAATVVSVPVAYPVIILRVDRFSSTLKTQQEQDEHEEEAEVFRSSLKMQSLSGYDNGSTSPSPDAQIVSELTYAFPFKVIADIELTIGPAEFLKQLMEAVADPSVQPLSWGDAALSEQFNELYNGGAYKADLEQGATEAHQQIIQNYLHNPNYPPVNGWISFHDIGQWLTIQDRASITQYLQYGNDLTHAAYFHAFVDQNGNALDGSKSSYTIHFAANQLPQASRFWSITAYTPEAIELVPNALNKYHVANYTPELQFDPDGSLTIYVGTSKPLGVPEANYLPTPSGQFNLMLRVYGPEGQALAGDYVPPVVVPQN